MVNSFFKDVCCASNTAHAVKGIIELRNNGYLPTCVDYDRFGQYGDAGALTTLLLAWPQDKSRAVHSVLVHASRFGRLEMVRKALELIPSATLASDWMALPLAWAVKAARNDPDKGAAVAALILDKIPAPLPADSMYVSTTLATALLLNPCSKVLGSTKVPRATRLATVRPRC